MDKIIEFMDPENPVLTVTKNELKWWERFLYFIGFRGIIGKTYELKKPSLFNAYRISSICDKFKIPEKATLQENDKGVFEVYINSKKADFKTQARFLKDNVVYLAQIAAIVLRADNKKPDKAFIEWLILNLSTEKLCIILSIVVKVGRLGFFLPISILIRRENL